jgi:hypothetical protein
MAKTAEELKAALVRRVEARTEEIPDPEYLDQEEVDYVEEDDFPELEPVDYSSIDEDPSDSEITEELYAAQSEVAEEAGFNAFLEGVEYEENPFITDPELTEGLDEQDVVILAEGWGVGWNEACKEAWTARVLLGAKDLVESTDPEAAEDALNDLMVAVEALGQMINYDAYSAFWRGEDAE